MIPLNSYVTARLLGGLALCVLLGVGLPKTSAATTIVAPDRLSPNAEPGTPFQAWVDESRIPTPEGTVTVLFDSQRAWVAYAEPRAIHWYTATGPLDETSHANFMHELGHVWNLTLPPGPRRYMQLRFERIMYPDWLWIGWDSLSEEFAMAYSFCALGVEDPPTDYFWGYEYDPTPGQQHRACGLIRHTASLIQFGMGTVEARESRRRH